MKLYKGIYISMAAAAILCSCSKEDPFPDGAEYDGPVGQILTSCLAPSLTNEEYLAATRATAPAADDFTVEIRKAGSDNVYKTYRYAEMPEMLTLPVASYTVRAYHGDNKDAAWEEPYFHGETSFDIKANTITDDVEPIVAKFSNIRVTIVFDPALKAMMSADTKVTVKAGEAGSMEFAADEARSAYFRYVDNSQTLIATISGIVDGSQISETKGYENVAPGNHYKITFRMHNASEDAPGNIEGGVKVDASVEEVNMNVTVDGEEDEVIADDMRPVQGGSTEPDPGPGGGDETPDQPGGEAPKAEALKPDPNGEYKDFDTLNLEGVNIITDHLYAAWKVVSEAEGGFTGFKVVIDSETLPPSELGGVGLAEELDLVNPGEFEEALEGLGFPVNIGGKTEAEFDITTFLTLLGALGPGDSRFIMTITDANGTTELTLTLRQQ